MNRFPIMPLRRLRSYLLLGIAIAAFVLLVLLTPHAAEQPWLALGLFFGLLCLLRLLSQFERPSP